jgi:transposase InsO family protein
MGREAIAMDVRLVAAFADESVNVTAFCAEVGISTPTFYKYRKRFDGTLASLRPRSRAPERSPKRTAGAVEDEIVGLRKELLELGVDAGPSTIQWHLGRRGHRAVPSVATIWRVLVRRGFVVPEPKKRPKSSLRCFVASAPNELWQTDATDWVVGDLGQVQILSFLDDCSRVALRCRAVPTATTENTWETFSQAAALWGLPLGQLSDNGLNFSGRLRGMEVGFEINLRAAGVRPITSRPFHPQTCGKVERFQQTLKKWLRRQPVAADLAELQDQLDRFVDYYNHHRPHRGIGRVTPAERWAATPPAINLGVALPGPTRTASVIVDTNGVARAHGKNIYLGPRYARRPAQVFIDDTHAAVFVDGLLARALHIDPTRRYQPAPPRALRSNR